MKEHKDIHEAISAVMHEVGYVQKQKTQGLNYSYAGEAALIEALRPSMVEHGIYMTVNQITRCDREQYVTKNGTAMINTVVLGVVRFTHVSGSFVDVHAGGEGADSGDKSLNKAQTGMYKYALRQTFNIETGDDPDRFPSGDQERPPKILDKKPAPEPKTPPVANDIQQARTDFGLLFAKAKELGIPDNKIPRIKGDMTIAQIKVKMGEVQTMIDATNSQEQSGEQDVSTN